MPTRSIVISDAASSFRVTADLLAAKAPQNVEFLWNYLAEQRTIPSIHAMWTGPEISCPVPARDLEPFGDVVLPSENATVTPQPGDIVLSYVPARVWGGGPDPIFDIGLFYGVGARLFFPIGWIPGSVVGRVSHDQLPVLAAACGAVRNKGACDLNFSRAEI